MKTIKDWRGFSIWRGFSMWGLATCSECGKNGDLFKGEFKKQFKGDEEVYCICKSCWTKNKLK